MATIRGNDGTVLVGTSTVAEIVSFELTTNANTTDDTVLGDSWDTHIAGTKNWSGSINCYYDETDTTGQDALVEGSEVTVHLVPKGDSTGNRDYTGTVTITSVSYGGFQNNTTATANFSFTGNGALTRTTRA
jgi:hypothetical protein